MTATCSPSAVIAPGVASVVAAAMDVEGGGGSDATGWEDPPLLLLLLLTLLLLFRPPPIGRVAAVFPVPTLALEKADATAAAAAGRVVAGGMTLCRKIQSYVPSPLLCRYPWKTHREAKERKARAAATVCTIIKALKVSRFPTVRLIAWETSSDEAVVVEEEAGVNQRVRRRRLVRVCSPNCKVPARERRKKKR